MRRQSLCLCLILCALLTTASFYSSPLANVSAHLHSHNAAPKQTNAPLTVPTRRGQPLWPGSRFTVEARERAVLRGLNFIYRTALQPKNFRDYGSDYIWCFYSLSEAFEDQTASQTARRMGLERARFWRRTHRFVPADADAGEIADLAFGDDAATSLGLPDDTLHEQLKRAAQRFSARDFLLFDPHTEPPPADVPAECDYCGADDNPRGSKICRVCKHRLQMRTRYDVWYDALITAYVGDRSGILLGAHYVDVLKWLPTLRPYHASYNDQNDVEFYDTVYAITHIVYTLNNYSQYRLSPELLPQEFEFLKANLREAIKERDDDMLGEFMDALRAFGLTTADPLIRKGMEYYLTHQNPDGSWGDMHEKDIYSRYHPTWNAIAGLSEYKWKSEGLSFPEVKPLLEQWNGATSSSR